MAGTTATEVRVGAHTMLKASRLICLLFASACITFPAHADGAALKKASLIIQWSPQAQFAGYYVALDRGIYRKHGIDLTIIPGGPDRSPTEMLHSGSADFAILWLSTALQHYSASLKLVNLAQYVQQTSMVLIARKSSGITTPGDMQGKKVGIWKGDLAIPPQAFFKKYHLQVRKIPQSYTVNLFLRGGIDVASAMWYNEYHTIINAGVKPDELSLFSLKDYGVNFPEDGLYTLEKTLHKDPSFVEAFARASLEGWQYAFAKPEEALDIIIKRIKAENIPANRSHQKWMLERMRDLMMPGKSTVKIGQLKPSDYEAVGTELLRQGVISSFPRFEDFIGSPNARK